MELGRAVRESADVVFGWRAWIVVDTPAGIRLGSVLHDLVWVPDEPALAACRRDEDPFATPVGAHPVPSATCNCGFHAARDPSDAVAYLRGRDGATTICRVLGEVALWGHVLETEGGWRASHACPAHLYVPDEMLAEQLGVYGVPISSAGCEPPSSRICTAMRLRSELRSRTLNAKTST